jgi:hypothetical protein
LEISLTTSSPDIPRHSQKTLPASFELQPESMQITENSGSLSLHEAWLMIVSHTDSNKTFSMAFFFRKAAPYLTKTQITDGISILFSSHFSFS